MITDKPRVLIFSAAYYPWVGGAEVALKELTDRLSDYKWELVTVNFDNSQTEQECIGNVLVHRLPGGLWGKYLFPWRAACWAARRHQETPYKLVWAMMANQAGMAAAIFKKRLPVVPFLLTLQEGDDLGSLAYRLRLWGPRLLNVFKLPDRIQAISNYLVTWAKAMGATCPMTVIPNGVDLSKFKVQSSKSKKEEKRDAKIIITTSRLVKKNGIDDLIRSLTFLPDDVVLQILGDGPEKAALKALVSKLGLGPRVSFLGLIESSGLARYLGSADAFCRPSRSEGLGNSFLEAMAMGLPTIGTPVGGIPDFLRDGETGWLARVDDPESIAEKAGYILDANNAAQIRSIIVAAQQLVKSEYNWDHLALRFRMVIDSLVQLD
ncbi:MAG: glycosyltransferase family 4 protein [Patescibacteria group bacterium]|nr:glycosyltransferase family 4 protein [Patescibacteria group bacterium]